MSTGAAVGDPVEARAYATEAARHNLDRVALALWALAAVHAAHVVVFGWAVEATDARAARWQSLILTAHALMIGPALAGAWLARRAGPRPLRWRRAPVVGAGLYLLFAAVLATIDQLVLSSPIAFVVAAIGIAAALRFEAIEVWIIYPLGLLAVVVGIELAQGDMTLRRSAQVNCLTVAAVSVVIARSNARLHRQHFADRRTIERQARTDALTGALTRGAFMDAVARVLGTPASLVMLDIDHLKAINDGSGHAAGDAVLVAVTRAARGALRSDDRLGRLGGDELAALLPRASLATASVVAERLRAAVAAAGASVSLGVAEYVPGETAERWLARADEALYRAKHGGRDRVAT